MIKITHNYSLDYVHVLTYRTAIVPDALVAHIPPSEAFAPGSIGKFKPVS
jgi:hypothetical protein